MTLPPPMCEIRAMLVREIVRVTELRCQYQIIGTTTNDARTAKTMTRAIEAAINAIERDDVAGMRMATNGLKEHR